MWITQTATLFLQEGVEAQFEDPEQWEDEEEEEEDDEEDMMEDEDGVDDSEGLEMGDMPGHEIDIDLHFDLPQAMGRGVFGGIGGAGAAAVPTQVTLLLDRVGIFWSWRAMQFM